MYCDPQIRQRLPGLPEGVPLCRVAGEDRGVFSVESVFPPVRPVLRAGVAPEHRTDCGTPAGACQP